MHNKNINFRRNLRTLLLLTLALALLSVPALFIDMPVFIGFIASAAALLTITVIYSIRHFVKVKRARRMFEPAPQPAQRDTTMTQTASPSLLVGHDIVPNDHDAFRFSSNRKGIYMPFSSDDFEAVLSRAIHNNLEGLKDANYHFNAYNEAGEKVAVLTNYLEKIEYVVAHALNPYFQLLQYAYESLLKEVADTPSSGAVPATISDVVLTLLEWQKKAIQSTSVLILIAITDNAHFQTAELDHINAESINNLDIESAAEQACSKIFIEGVCPFAPGYITMTKKLNEGTHKHLIYMKEQIKDKSNGADTDLLTPYRNLGKVVSFLAKKHLLKSYVKIAYSQDEPSKYSDITLPQTLESKLYLIVLISLSSALEKNQDTSPETSARYKLLLNDTSSKNSLVRQLVDYLLPLMKKGFIVNFKDLRAMKKIEDTVYESLKSLNNPDQAPNKNLAILNQKNNGLEDAGEHSASSSSLAASNSTPKNKL